MLVIERFQNMWCQTEGQIRSPDSRYATPRAPLSSSQLGDVSAKRVKRSYCERSRISYEATSDPATSPAATTPATIGLARRGASTAKSRTAAAASAYTVSNVISETSRRRYSSGTVESASAAAARVVIRSTGRRSADAATAIVMTDVTGCGRGIPRASHTAKATNAGGTTDRS
jgi:hypothetical protein